MRILQGIPASPGYLVTRIHRIAKEEARFERRDVAPSETAAEVDRFHGAVTVARDEIADLVERLSRELGPDEAAILETQLLILEDELLIEGVESRIREASACAEAALHDTVVELVGRFDSLEQDYIRERVLDLRDVEERLLRQLLGLANGDLDLPDEPRALAAEDLTPSETASLDGDKVQAFLIGGGSRTSHVAILARSMGVPAVVGLGDALADLVDGAVVVVDGRRGEVVLEPDTETLARVRQFSQQQQSAYIRLAHLRDEPAETPEGRRVRMHVNIEMPAEMDLALEAGAEGVGLLRTEYIYFRHRTIPSEEDQYETYCEFLRRMDGRPITFRTLDVGGDKVQRYLGARQESNPFLGWRGIRFLLANRPLLKSQLRAVYRAGAVGPSRLMFPMISGVEELRAARELCAEIRDDLAREGIEHDPDLPLGIMIETPSAALTTDLLARECDFVSIGTNDLIQYTLAMDRLNERVAYLYQPLHPAVLRSLRDTVAAARDAGVSVSICGEMASETRYAEILLGLGFDELSVHAAQLPKIKQVVRWTSMDEARGLLEDLLACATADEATRLHETYLEDKKRRRAEGEGG